MDGNRKPRVPPSVPGDVVCLKCNRRFTSPDHKAVRICKPCKSAGERLGFLSESISHSTIVYPDDFDDY